MTAAEHRDPELARRALEWCKRHDGGRLCAKERGDDTDLTILWDNGGDDEFASVYDGFQDSDAELICDLVNFALELLVPSETNYYGTRTYLAEGD
ncbi:hypothetical protein ACFXG4_08485 [Nocardia sp. NPDC059246]|uniref:hypothetical protein n=1 Tax=unclassified Nocardia TaxID=2637762 RepID=UPI0036CB2906